ncbi:hypothetical protein D3C75_332200 [compost metagenome]
MIPNSGQTLNEATEETLQPSQTYRLDLDSGRILGTMDGLEAIRQAVVKIILTERYDYLTYTPDYGAELKGLFGGSPAFVRSELRRRIQEALLQDERIESVENLTFAQDGDQLTVTFTVVSAEGVFDEEVLVNV